MDYFGNDDDFQIDSDQEAEDEKQEAKDEMALARGSAKKQAITPCPDSVFKKELKKYAAQYVKIINKSEGKFEWKDITPSQGDGFDDTQRRKIRQEARLLDASIAPMKKYSDGTVDFPPSRIKGTIQLPKHLYKGTDPAQFKYCDDEMEKKDANYIAKKRKFKGSAKKYTWHHDYKKGKMQLVEMGIHETTSHKGGKEIWGGGAGNR